VARRAYLGRRSAAVAAAVAAIGAHGGSVVAAARSPELTNAQFWALSSYALLWIPWAAIAIVIATRGLRRIGTIMLAIAMALIALSEGLGRLAERVPELPRPPLLAVTLLVSFLAAGAYLRAAQLFPKALTVQDLHGPEAPWLRLPLLRRAMAWLLRPWAAWAAAGLWLAAALNPVTAVATTPPFIALGAAYWYIHFRIGTAKTRRQVTWFLQTAVIFVVLNLIALGLSQLLDAADAGEARAYVAIVYYATASVACCGSVAMGVFGAGAVNPGLVVRATLIYGAATTLLLFVLNVIVSVAVDWAADALGVSDRVAAAALGSLAGLLLEPFAAALRKLLRFGREREEPVRLAKLETDRSVTVAKMP
jgi:hypothetical protein